MTDKGDKCLLTREEFVALIDRVYPCGIGTYNPTPFDYAISEAQDTKTRKAVEEGRLNNA